MGINNFFLGLLSAQFGVHALWPLCFCYLLMWLCYRARVPFDGFYSSKARVVGLFVRAANHACLVSSNILTFYFAAQAHINIGVIAALFTTAVLYTTLLFRATYGERIRWPCFAGMLTVCLGVAVISLGKEQTGSSGDIESGALFWVVMWANLSGVFFASNALIMRYYVQNCGFTVFQLNLDGFALQFPFLFALWFS
jgi:drug/metabolite transporter (DMT)-like permease